MRKQLELENAIASELAGSGDAVLRALNAASPDEPDRLVIPGQDLHKFCLLYGPESRIPLDLDALWESRPIGSYHGEPCLVLDDLGDRLHIVYLGMEERRAGRMSSLRASSCSTARTSASPRSAMSATAADQNTLPTTAASCSSAFSSAASPSSRAAMIP